MHICDLRESQVLHVLSRCSVPCTGNADRHHYETYARAKRHGKLLHIDNGKRSGLHSHSMFVASYISINIRTVNDMLYIIGIRSCICLWGHQLLQCIIPLHTHVLLVPPWLLFLLNDFLCVHCSFGNPGLDEMSILAPLSQCCR